MYVHWPYERNFCTGLVQLGSSSYKEYTTCTIDITLTLTDHSQGNIIFKSVTNDDLTTLADYIKLRNLSLNSSLRQLGALFWVKERSLNVHFANGHFAKYTLRSWTLRGRTLRGQKMSKYFQKSEYFFILKSDFFFEIKRKAIKR